MKQEEFQRFSEVISAAAELYGKALSPMAVMLYWNALKSYDVDAVIDAISRYIEGHDNGHFMPKPADITKLIGGSSKDVAAAAWTKVDKAVRHIGTWQSVAFDDPIIHAVLLDMGSWVSLGQKTEKEWPFVAQDFIERYRAYRNRGGVSTYPPVLVGITEAHNGSAGFPVDPPVLIGNRDDATRVIENGRRGGNMVEFHVLDNVADRLLIAKG